MIATIDPAGGSPLAITSLEALDARVAAVVRSRIQYTAALAAMEQEMAAVQKKHQARLGKLLEEIAADEDAVSAYCQAHRAELFPDKKSRETTLAVFGFELTPPRVEPSNRKIKWADVVARLIKLSWGKAYLNQPEPKPDKNALLADREQLSPEQLTAAGIRFCQEEQFFLRPKPETAADSTTEVAS